MISGASVGNKVCGTIQTAVGIRYTNRENHEKSLIRGGLHDDQAEFIEHHLRRALRMPDEENS